MSEADWLDDFLLFKLIRLLPDYPDPSKRKLRLFGVACCRRAVEEIGPPVFPEIIDGCERAADMPDGNRLLDRLAVSARRHGQPLMGGDLMSDVWCLSRAVEALTDYSFNADYIADHCRDALYGHDDFVSGHGEMLFQADLLRDIFGNPFRPVAFDPGWRTATAVALAREMYDAREFDRMPILADAIEEAGCDAVDLLAHCRDPQQVHVRGCWVVDLVLGKK